jgi:NADPH-dependent 2,4-dienoyl-CoA reductase/sulfur reductase-like enzyme
VTHDLIIIGAGPAGMAAALAASKLGLKTAVLDEQLRPGGQIYCNVGEVAPQAGRLLGSDYLHGRPLAARFLDAGVDRHLATTVWDIAQDLTVSAMAGGRGFQLRAPQLIAATGAMERASPLPGWTLPGVLNAGAAQIAQKSSGSIPSGRIVLVGCGPLLLLVACQLLAAGADIAGIVETAPAANRRAALREMAEALLAPKLLAKGLAMIRQIRRARVRGSPRRLMSRSKGTSGPQRYTSRPQASRSASRRISYCCITGSCPIRRSPVSCASSMPGSKRSRPGNRS